MQPHPHTGGLANRNWGEAPRSHFPHRQVLSFGAGRRKLSREGREENPKEIFLFLRRLRFLRATISAFQIRLWPAPPDWLSNPPAGSGSCAGKIPARPFQNRTGEKGCAARAFGNRSRAAGPAARAADTCSRAGHGGSREIMDVPRDSAGFSRRGGSASRAGAGFSRAGVGLSRNSRRFPRRSFSRPRRCGNFPRRRGKAPATAGVFPALWGSPPAPAATAAMILQPAPVKPVAEIETPKLTP